MILLETNLRVSVSWPVPFFPQHGNYSESGLLQSLPSEGVSLGEGKQVLLVSNRLPLYVLILI
jgi:hypothetical protein